MSGKKTDLNKAKGKIKPEESMKKTKAVQEKSAVQTKAAAKASTAKPTAKTAEPAKTAAKKPAAKSAPKVEKAPEKATARSAAPADSAKKAATKPSAKNAHEKAVKKPVEKSVLEKAVDNKKKAPTKQTKATVKSPAAEKEQTKKAPAAKAEAKSDNKPSAKKPAKKQESAEPSSKTPHVMKLVEQKNDMINPTIMAGKSSIPRRLRGLEPLSRIIKREAEEVFGGDSETYNLTALVIEEHAPEILRRFNACDCEICVETLSRLTAEMVPARFAKLRRSTVERDLEEVRQLKDPLRRPVTSHMVRLVMQNKKRSYHD